MSITPLEQLVLTAIDENVPKIISLGEQIRKNPELGYREEKTAALVRETFAQLEIPWKDGLALTGVKATCGTSGPHVCVLGELDAVVCSDHPEADQHTGASHACGHNAQIAAMLGAAIGLVKSGIMDQLTGRISFFAVPAEEYIDLVFRRSLRKEGKIKYFGGKQQLIAEGAFDDVDMALMVHAHQNTPEPSVYANGSSLGFCEKQVTFHGKAVHASEPFDGVNALNAAALAILGMHANRERFKEEDRIRVHPIITKGGDVVNTVPDEVCMDSYVRGASFGAIQSASLDTDRAIRGAAAMVGADVDIRTQTGYFPLIQNEEMSELFCQVAKTLVPEMKIYNCVNTTGSSDIGDLSQLMPCIQPTIGGFTGKLHSKDFGVADCETAYILPAKIMALTVVRLLSSEAAAAKEILANYKPQMTKEDYLMRLDNR